VGEGIYGVDRTGNITFANPAAAHMLGWEAETLLGQPVHAYLHPPHSALTSAQEGECLIVSAMRDGVSRQVSEDRFWRRDGSSFLVEYVCTPMREGEVITGAVVLFKDITARKQIEQEMQRADRLALVGQLASGLAHEIGTPLNVIAGNAELLRMEVGGQANQAAALDTIMLQADRISRLVQQLLTFARTQPQAMQPVALAEPLSHVLSLLEARFRHVGITTIVDMPADLPLVWGAAEQLEQVFLNVLVNAWHAMPTGGVVTIRGSVSADKMVQLAFQDTGRGMSATDLARACEPFFSTKGEQGTGLGLAICKQILDSHQGRMYLHSTLGHGTTVTFLLQRADAVAFAS
jgi:PAS domain S-box-containing protein